MTTITVTEDFPKSLRHAIGLIRFTLRGRQKVNTQWVLFNIVHNLLKIHRYGFGFT